MMKPRFMPLIALGTALAVSGCVGTTDVSRNLGFDAAPTIEVAQVLDFDIRSFEVNVPYSLTASEANGIKPRADIVWRGEPMGDRHQQVDALMTQALAPAFDAVNGSVPVVVTLDVTRFHSQTQRVRYSNLPSEHEIEFNVTISHATTGQIIMGPTHVDLTFDALGGQRAIEAEGRGETPQVRITQRLRNWVAEQFSPAAASAGTA